jgi:two-component system nitrate/nitrite sensor histidine kinase NarX
VRRDLIFLFREAVHNAAKYGHDPVAVRVDVEGRRLRFLVEDAGPGFDPATVEKGRGLDTMKRRAAALGRTLEPDSAPGRGTRVRLEVTLREARPRLRRARPPLG